jgi:flagellar FliJ protein
MINPHSLKLLLDHAQQKMDDSATKLGKLNVKQQETEKTLGLLLDYRDSYQSRFMESAGNGIDPIEWQNFRAFISKLDAAIREQQKIVTRTLQLTEAGSAEFQAHRQRLKSYDTLSQRSQLDHAANLIKQEQYQQDEHTANGVCRHPKAREPMA